MSRNLRIIHCLRAPVGGLFRHVVDLALEQSYLGHEVGVLYDPSHETEAVAEQMRLLHQHCRLGVRTAPMARLLSYKDYFAYRALVRFGAETKAQILHGHGAKGGAYARLAAAYLSKKTKGHKQRIYGFYTPHGGSLHFSPKRFSGRMFLGLEKKLARYSGGLIFESRYSADLFHSLIGGGFCATKVIPNGLKREEFAPAQPIDGAADFVFVGELRRLKGVDVLLEALKALRDHHVPVRLAIVGDGPDMAEFQTLSRALGLEQQVTFHGRLGTRQALVLGRAILVPSRAESFPYIVLEAGAAQVPIIATDVGGISEITEGTEIDLIPPDDVMALADKMEDFLTNTAKYQHLATQLTETVARKFTVEVMTASVTDFYLSVLRP